jgi:hypothetical protein
MVFKTQPFSFPRENGGKLLNPEPDVVYIYMGFPKILLPKQNSLYYQFSSYLDFFTSLLQFKPQNGRKYLLAIHQTKD